MKKISLYIIIAIIILTSFMIWYRAEKTIITAQPMDTIIVGTNAEFQPFSFKQDETITGFDIDVITEILKRLNKKMVIKDMPFDALLPEIQLGNIHVIAAGITPTPERAQRALFTRPHLSGNPLMIITQKNNPITSINDLVGKTVVVNEGYVADSYISEHPAIHLIRLSSAAVSDGMLALESKRADAFVTALHPMKPYFAKYDMNNFSVIPIPDTEESSAFAISKHYPELRDYIQNKLDQMQSDGTLDTLKKKMESFMIIDINLIIEYLPLLLQGLVVTLQIAGISCCIGLILGTILALMETSKNAILRTLVTIYVVIIRGTPMLIQIFSAYFLLPQIGIHISAFWTAIIAIGLNSAAYISQIIRSGISSIGIGQIEAAKVLGFSTYDTIVYIILPQALRTTLPSLGNEFVTLIKDSSLASLIGVAELTKQGNFIKSKTFDAITVYFAIAILYLIITSTISFLVARLEKRMNIHAQD